MYKFTFNQFGDNGILIEKDNKIVLCFNGLADQINSFNFFNWCQQWLDERDLTDVEYQIFIRVH